MGARVIKCEFLKFFFRKDKWEIFISGMYSKRVCMKFNFLGIEVIESQLCLWICKIFFSNLSKNIKKYMRTWFFPLSRHQLLWHLIKNVASLIYQGNKNEEEVHYSRKVNFQCQRNPQKYKNWNKIIPCKVWAFL